LREFLTGVKAFSACADAARLELWIVKPPVAEVCAAKAAYDVPTIPDAFPDELGLEILNHQNNRTLIQPEYPRRDPAVWISACVRVSWIKTGGETIRTSPFQIETFNGVTDSVDYDLGREG
jgi:hypothetical protein